jgi:hypothetical protein
MSGPRVSRRRARLVSSGVVAGFVIAGTRLLRHEYLRWGAVDDEVAMRLPGDGLIRQADLTATRAVTIHAAAADVWPWIVQLGQGRGGFYSYDFLENLVGCDIHSADRIVQEWQQLDVGATVRLAPELPLTVAVVETGTALVLRGGIPLGGDAAPYDFTWAFVLNHAPDGSTRLVVRERYEYLRRWAPFVIEPVQFASSVMSRRMLHGVKERAECATKQRP